jgi:hypothetical protein
MMPANKQHRVRKALEDKQKEELIALLVQAYQEHPQELLPTFLNWLPD